MFEKTDSPGYLKNTKTGVVINSNDGDYQRVVAAREKYEAEKALQNEVKTLKSDVEEIKSMLSKILYRISV